MIKKLSIFLIVALCSITNAQYAHSHAWDRETFDELQDVSKQVQTQQRLDTCIRKCIKRFKSK